MPPDPRFDGPGPDARWQEALSGGTFMIQVCDQCDAAQFPPAVICRACRGPSMSLVPATGIGTVHSTTTVRSRDGGRNVALVALSEGPRMMTRVTGDPDAVRIGQTVHARVESGDTPCVVFDPEDAS